MVCTIPASAWTWLVRPRKASTVMTNGTGLDAGEGNPGGFYSNSYGVPVPEVLTVSVAYHAIVLRRSLRGPCGAVRGVLPPLGNVGLASLTSVRSVVRRLTLPYLCQADPNHVESATSLVQLSGGAGT
ncbi:hypothetical protein B296_00048001 [Ensete ventricosum]|uniref:Uncharacterized protein n=1 Tax=Ensete ventricosum TaxID=4639 RepID=A0A426X0Y2_ENSVE|nr:hypothetical protein B296_00048001 [Ensete ventricosum]